MALLLVLALAEPSQATAQSPAPVAVELGAGLGDWFEVYRILPGVFTIREPGHWERVISYLVVGSERALLFDTGTGIGNIRAVVAKLTELEIVVVNSHSHPDHVGGNHQFETIYGLDNETAARAARGRSVEDSQRFVPERAFSRKPPATFSRESYRIHPWKLSRYVGEGDTIDLGGRKLEVWETPGHAADSLCLIDRENRFVLTGDTFYLGRLFVASDAGSLERYAASAARLAKLTGKVDRVLPAHSATLLQPRFLKALGKAFRDVLRGEVEPEPASGGRQEFRFKSFSIVAPAQ